jgi:beta-N-acetylhexosaminidase
MDEMAAVAGETPPLSGDAARRADAALAARTAPEEFDTEAARKIFAQMVADERPAPQWKTGS